MQDNLSLYHIFYTVARTGSISHSSRDLYISQPAISKAHSHTNKAELDKIVTGDKAKWDAAEQKAHEHGNKTILDTISQDKVDAWDGAVAKQHEHANKTVLDGISAEKVTDWDSKAAGNHEHDITELKQASGYIVFNCGSASVNI